MTTQAPPGYTSPGPFVSQGGPPAGTVPSPGSENIYQQIEATAGLYEPAIYELLSFYSAFLAQPDELDGQFVPLTDVRPTNSTQTLLFAVGILPPSSNVTGRLLDPSATTATSMPATAPNTNPVQGVVAGGTTPGPYMPSAGVTQFIGSYTPFSSTPVTNPAGVTTIGYGHIVQPGESFPTPLTPNQGQQLLGQDLGQAAAKVNQAVTAPLTQNQFDALTAYTQGTGSIQNAPFLSALNKGNYSAATQVLAQSSVASGGQISPTLQTIRVNQANLFATPAGSSYLYQGSSATLNIPSTSTVINGDGSMPANQWKGTGSPNYAQAQQNLTNLANNNLNTSNLGQSFLQAQSAMITATQQAIQQMANTPPLKMLVNPTSFKLSAEKIIADGDWGRNGPIVEQWGEAQDKLEASGKVAAFYSLDVGGTGGAGGVYGGPGITRIARQYSAAYQNFLSLWLLYKNNGALWINPMAFSPMSPNTGTASPAASQATNLSVLGSIYLYYDNILYIGSFDNFNLTESETAPYTLEYNFSFTVRATFLLDNTDDLSLQLSGLAQSQLNPLAGIPSPNQIGTSPSVAALLSQNGQPAGQVNPPPGLSPQQYTQSGVGAPGVSVNSFTNRPR